MLTEQDFLEQRERMQEDIDCILYGCDDDDIVDNCCQVIVDRIEILLEKFKQA
jgi:hypothetical protein